MAKMKDDVMGRYCERVMSRAPRLMGVKRDALTKHLGHMAQEKWLAKGHNECRPEETPAECLTRTFRERTIEGKKASAREPAPRPSPAPKRYDGSSD